MVLMMFSSFRKQDLEPARVFAIGDIHGCSTALKILLSSLDLQADDTVITLGDHVDWGPDSKGVIDQLLELEGECHRISLLGNHEVMMRESLLGSRDLRAWMDFGGEQTTESYGDNWQWPDLPESHRHFLESCRLFHETDDAIFVHANYAPNSRMSQQRTYDLLWMDLDPRKAFPHYSGKTVFCGHTPQRSGEIKNLGFQVCLDTDCCRNGWLTALEIHSGQIYQANQWGHHRTLHRKWSR